MRLTLSILYLRCQVFLKEVGRQTACVSFNSLFEMRRLYDELMRLARSVVSFNSLFEMPLNRYGRSRGYIFGFQFSI